MDGYLSKPIDPTMLYAALEHESAPRTAASGTAAPSSSGSIDRAQMMDRLGGDEQLFVDVVRLFLADCPARVADIKAAVDQRDAERIRLTAHALKGAAGNLSAAGLFEAARTLERIGTENKLDAADAAWRQLSIEAANVMDTLRQFEMAAVA
jgi:HPt (histidine-containing phosphotransfer) domain-containing protein